MSDFFAIGGVSATLQTLLRDRMELPGDVLLDDLLITIGTPRAETQAQNGSAVEEPRVNLFLYKVAENPFLKNQEIPGQGSPGAYGRPPLSLNLYYLLTVYGSTADGDFLDERRAQFLLGSAMRTLHDFPVVTDRLTTVRGIAGRPILHSSLLGAFEKVKITLDPVSLEDLSKVWTALTIPFRLSAGYLVNVVQIESPLPRRFPKPVGEPPLAGPRIFVAPFRRAQIEEVRVRRPGDPADLERPFPHARIGDTLILRGANFLGDGWQVVLGGLRIPVTPLALDRIEFVLPDDSLLRPGAQTVAVTSSVPGLPQVGFSSNVAVFMLVPGITPPLAANLGLAPRELTINGTRLFDAGLSGETIVGLAVIPKASYLTATPTQITVPLPDTLPGFPVDALLSGDLAMFPVLPDPAEVSLTMGGDGPHAATLAAPPATLVQTPPVLEAAIRSAAGAGHRFRNARVGLVGNQLLILPGGLNGAVSCDAGTTADALRLTGATGATTPQVYLSGALTPFPPLASATPAVNATLAGTLHTVTLPVRPATLAQTAILLEAALRSFPEPPFASARVAVIGDQLCILPGAPGVVLLAAAPGDATTLSELQLRGPHPVRVRVNGAESLDDVVLNLPS